VDGLLTLQSSIQSFFSPEIALARWIYGRPGATTELSRELTWVGNSADHSELW